MSKLEKTMTYKIKEIRIEKVRNGRISNRKFWSVVDPDGNEVFFTDHKVEAENFIKFEGK